MPRDDIRSEQWDLKLIPDLTGKVTIVTGANDPNGVGFNIAHQLALKGAKVYIGARNETKAQTAIQAIIKSSPLITENQLGMFIADMADLKQVKSSAEKFAASENRLDILVNNAGLLARPLDKDANGISISMLTNHLSVFVLTTTLLPLIKKTAELSPGVRVVTLSSTAHKDLPGPVRFESLDALNVDFGGVDGMPFNYFRYGLSKLANLLFTKELQRRFETDGVDAVAVSLHPGGVKTSGAIAFIGNPNSKLLDGSLTPLEGAITALFAATAPEVHKEKLKYAGAYLMPFGIPSPEDESDDAKSPILMDELWTTSEKVVVDLLSK